MPNSKYSIDDMDIPVLRVMHGGLSFNKYCIQVLNAPEFLHLRLDRNNKKLAIRVGVEGKDFLCRYDTDVNEQKTRLYITSQQLYEQIVAIADADPQKKAVGYIADLNIERNTLLVDLTKSFDAM